MDQQRDEIAINQIGSRIGFFDIAKGIAIYLVVFGHLISDSNSDIALCINLCHMPLFFFICGYFFLGNYIKYNKEKLRLKDY